MENAVNHQSVMISSEQLIDWSQINLIPYLPSSLPIEVLVKEKPKKEELINSRSISPEFEPVDRAYQQQYTLTIAPIAERLLKAHQIKTYQGKNNLIEYVDGRLTIKDAQGNYKMIAQSAGVDEHQQTIWQCLNLPLNSPGLTITDVEQFTNPAMEQAITEKQLQYRQQNHQPSQQRRGRRR